MNSTLNANAKQTLPKKHGTPSSSITATMISSPLPLKPKDELKNGKGRDISALYERGVPCDGDRLSKGVSRVTLEESVSSGDRTPFPGVPLEVPVNPPMKRRRERLVKNPPASYFALKDAQESEKIVPPRRRAFSMSARPDKLVSKSSVGTWAKWRRNCGSSSQETLKGETPPLRPPRPGTLFESREEREAFTNGPSYLMWKSLQGGPRVENVETGDKEIERDVDRESLVMKTWEGFMSLDDIPTDTRSVCASSRYVYQSFRRTFPTDTASSINTLSNIRNPIIDLRERRFVDLTPVESGFTEDRRSPLMFTIADETDSVF